MRTNEVLKYVLSNVAHRKLRTFLTVLAIIVGIASIVAMISLGQGIQKRISEDLQKFSPRTLFIVPGDIKVGQSRGISSLTGKLYEKDARAIERIPEVEKVAKLIGTRADLEFKGKQIKGMITGAEVDVFFEVSSAFELEAGRYLMSTDKSSVLLGYKIAKEGFDKEIQVNNKLYINGKPYTVVGIFKEQTSQVGGNPNNFVMLNYQEVRDRFGDSIPKDELLFMNVLIRDGFDVEEVAEKVSDAIIQSHKLPRGKKDFTVFSPKVIADQVRSITDMISAFLGSIASISLLVGAIGISNTMFSAVLERTKEIGTLKAIGATESDISNFFLLESVVLSLLGGFVGIVVAIALGIVLASFGVPYYTGTELIVGTFIFSLIIGISAGFIPARNAAKLSAVEALRYE